MKNKISRLTVSLLLTLGVLNMHAAANKYCSDGSSPFYTDCYTVGSTSTCYRWEVTSGDPPQSCVQTTSADCNPLTGVQISVDMYTSPCSIDESGAHCHGVYTYDPSTTVYTADRCQTDNHA